MSFLSGLFASKKRPITVNELKRAFHNHEFVFYYQPEWDLKTNRVIGVEALMRWESPSRGCVPPLQFIPLLEKSGVIHDFTNFLFEQTLADLAELHRIQPDLFMAVNLSISQLQETHLLDLIQKNLAAHDLDAKYLECELSESQELTEEIEANNILQKLSQLGVAISIDDFGTGYSSFARLEQVKIQKLTIDLCFIRKLFESEKNQAIVLSMIQLGHDLGCPVLAEGIETTEQQEWLRDNGCDYGQGYWFSRAVPLSQLKVFLSGKIKK